MFYLLFAILAAAGTTLTLKAATSRGASVPMLNFFYRTGMGCAAVVGLLLSFSIPEMAPLLAETWHLILPGIVFLYLAGITSMNAISTGHIGISTMVIRSSMLLPVGYSLAALYRESPQRFQHILPLAGLGCLLILLAFGCFGMEQQGRRHAIPISKAWLVWLGGSFFAQGGWDIVVVASAQLSTRETLFCYYLTSLGAALLSTRNAGLQISKPRWPLIAAGLGAGTLALAVSLVRPLAVKDLGGLIVIPTFAIGTMLLIQIFGSLFWKHHIGAVGWIGFVLSGLGITVLVLCRQ